MLLCKFDLIHKHFLFYTVEDCVKALPPPFPMQKIMLMLKSINWHLFELFADECECFVDGVRVAGHRHDALRARPVADVDLGAALQRKNK
jgi:hypothetical protein